MNARTDKRRARGWRGWLDWIGFGAGIAAALIAWTLIHGERGHGPDREVAGVVGSGAAATDPAVGRNEAQTGAGGTKGAANKPAGDSQAASSPNGTKGQGAAASNAAEQEPATAALMDKLVVRVYLSDEKKVETVPLETYVRGVVAAEMPLSFEPAALEAQALAARTYIIRRLLNEDLTGVPVDGADVTDTQTHQVYRSQAEMAALKVSDPKGWAKADEAAKRTKGKILTYGGEPIQALYFSSSDGYTENSENVFPFELPYLRSVASPWDREEASGWSDTLEMPLQEFCKKLGVSAGATLARGGGGTVRVADRTPGNQVRTLQVGKEKLTGVEVRDKLGLKSAAFDVTATGRNVVITTYGNGHGVGMSQWGAEGMAKSGRTAEQIVRYYYTGIQVEEASKLADRLFL